jgi:hypothetical protein
VELKIGDYVKIAPIEQLLELYGTCYPNFGLNTFNTYYGAKGMLRHHMDEIYRVEFVDSSYNKVFPVRLPIPYSPNPNRQFYFNPKELIKLDLVERSSTIYGYTKTFKLPAEMSQYDVDKILAKELIHLITKNYLQG